MPNSINEELLKAIEIANRPKARTNGERTPKITEEELLKAIEQLSDSARKIKNNYPEQSEDSWGLSPLEEIKKRKPPKPRKLKEPIDRYKRKRLIRINQEGD